MQSVLDRLSGVIGNACHSHFRSAVGAAEIPTFRFDPVPDDAAAAMVAFGSKGVDGTLEAIESVRPIVHNDHKRFVVVVSADFANSHD